ncbi:hypothetical protein AB9F29_00150 [Falsihalocynthiibacter sp. S25ZX9]|uniref:hypothetical protein n=1 Tax=Falsihalocynthiibacter sp. S25ZX9 TaxID=3240870 RepID=UPI0035104AD4
MTDAELIQELIVRKALIVHCSRPGKGDEGISGLLFPDDLRNAIEKCADENAELCCSVIWPGHLETFGDIGIILKAALDGFHNDDQYYRWGTFLDPTTDRRVGDGASFSRNAVEETFEQATDYN